MASNIQIVFKIGEIKIMRNMFILLVLMMFAVACSDTAGTTDDTSDSVSAVGDAVTVVSDVVVDTSVDTSVDAVEVPEADAVLTDEVSADVVEEDEVLEPEETDLDSDPTEFPDSDGSGDPTDSLPSDPIP